MNVSPTSAVSAAAARPGVTPHLGHALGGIWRITFRRAFSGKQVGSLLWSVALFGGLTILQSRHGPAAFYEWMTGFYLTIIIPILAFTSGAGAIREDMKPGAVDYLLTRAVPRTAFVVGRFFSHLVCVQASCLLAFIVVLGAGVYRGVDDLATTWPLLWFAQAAAITVFMGMGFCFGAISARYLVLGINYAAIVEIGLGSVRVQISNLSALHHVKSVLVPLSSNADKLAPQGVLVTALVLALFTLVWVGAAAVIFSLQQFAGQRPKDA